jgi:ABC-type Na+ efflux pump permease subunit
MADQDEQKVIVTDIRMPFGSMVVFLIKWAIASIPAVIILWFIMAILMLIFMTFFGGMAGLHSMFQQQSPVF